MRAALLSLACMTAVLPAVCGDRDAASPPAALTAATSSTLSPEAPLATRHEPLPPPAAVVPREAPPSSLADDEEPIDVSSLRLPQPEDGEPIPVR